MRPNTCLVVDVWEGQLEIDEAALKAGGVAGMGIRLNDMAGGHHMDANFTKQWAEAQNFVRFPYFVYNPWVSGAENYAWLDLHMPTEARAVAVDIEVRKDGLLPSKYAGEVAIFIGLCQKKWKTVVYTAEWFLSYLSKWPYIDYWWAQYPSSQAYFSGITTWEQLSLKLNNLDKPFNSSKVPGPLVMWQCSGDYLQLPGTQRKIDVNIFYGTPDDLAAYFGSSPSQPPISNSYAYLKPRYVNGGPSIIVGTNGITTNHIIIPLESTQQAWIKSLNKYDDGVYKLFVAADVGPTKGINDAGKMLYIMAGWSGNIVKIIGRKNGFVKIDTINLQKSLPNNADVNHSKTPWLVHRMTTVNKDNNFINYPPRPDGRPSAWDILDDPIFSSDGDCWIADEFVAQYATYNRAVNVRTGPSTQNTIIGSLPFGAKALIQAIEFDAAGNIWGNININQWCCLRYFGTAYTDWIIK